ncbi:hypothetical protein A2Y85_06140 [candidate division WOR-3 bacterium RBG_13_43_14]|uniref:Single cache domain-containing protein n=1 Tax=candidate division WOR-3 bacterium RBG_13_43_14 TaxID=1802590 RepID=A0A1F4UA61_UNCW3|nr:MAG: hypothetical protein A2Y85_06140 [candidate division WOR-3 bacterium RBG_13_43_14]
MSKAGAAIVAFIIVMIVSVVFFMSPRFLPTAATGDQNIAKDFMVKRFTNVGNLIAHATFVEDAVIMEGAANLNEIIQRFRRDEPEITYIHFTDGKGMVIASSDQNLMGKSFNSTLLKSSSAAVKENNGLYECGFTILVGKTRVGALYFGANPVIPEIKVIPSSSPLVLAIGAVFGIIAFIVILSMQRNVEGRIVEDINRRQEEVFSPKIDSLKKEQNSQQKTLVDLNQKVNEAQGNLEKVNVEYQKRKKEIESNPVVQSIEKLKVQESEMLKRLEKIKAEEQRLTGEISLLSQKREEIKSALEAEKKEESALHEKLDLIKKKILHLETPKK